MSQRQKTLQDKKGARDGSEKSDEKDIDLEPDIHSRSSDEDDESSSSGAEEDHDYDPEDESYDESSSESERELNSALGTVLEQPKTIKTLRAVLKAAKLITPAATPGTVPGTSSQRKRVALLLESLSNNRGAKRRNTTSTTDDPRPSTTRDYSDDDEASITFLTPANAATKISTQFTNETHVDVAAQSTEPVNRVLFRDLMARAGIRDPAFDVRLNNVNGMNHFNTTAGRFILRRRNEMTARDVQFLSQGTNNLIVIANNDAGYTTDEFLDAIFDGNWNSVMEPGLMPIKKRKVAADSCVPAGYFVRNSYNEAQKLKMQTAGKTAAELGLKC